MRRPLTIPTRYCHPVIAAVIAAALVLSMGGPAMAAGPDADPGLPAELARQYDAAGIFETGLVPDMPADAKCPKMTLHFGSRYNRSGNPRKLKDGFRHAGVDWALPVGTPILAIADGEVVAVRSDLDKAPGNHVIIKHSRAISSSYVHLSAFNVRLHQIVKKGEVVGFLGQTGTGATYAHLHLNIYGTGRMTVGDRVWRYRYDYLQFLSGDMTPIDPAKKRAAHVKVAYMDRAGKLHPREAKVIWPFVCD